MGHGNILGLKNPGILDITNKYLSELQEDDIFFVQKSRRKIHILDQVSYWLTSGPMNSYMSKKKYT